jgi:iron(III) transport system substrate-binding protein
MTITISRRALTTGLAAATLPMAARADTKALEEAARREGSLTWYVAQVDSETAEIMGRAFTQQYPGVKVSVIRTTGQVAYERLLQDLKNNAPQCDVFSTTDIAHMPALMKRNQLASYVPENAAFIGPAFQGLGEDGFYYPSTSTLMVMIANSTKVKPEEMPKSWTDLLDPRWQGKVALGHPGFSGYVGVWTVAMRKLYGWEFFEKLSKNNPRIGRSGNDPITLLNAGECLVGLAPLGTSLLSTDHGNPISVVYPTDGSVLCVGPSAVLASAPHPNAGRLFANWLMSMEFARICVEQRSDSVRAEVPPKAGAKPLSEVKLLRLTTAELGKQVPEVIEQWRDTFI